MTNRGSASGSLISWIWDSKSIEPTQNFRRTNKGGGNAEGDFFLQTVSEQINRLLVVNRLKD